MTLKENYDVIVAGGGPAGSLAAYAAAKEGVHVLLLEKDREIGSPVRCAEAVGKDGLENILDQPVNPQWIAATIKRFKFVAPDGSVVHPQVPMTGYVLHRKLFDVDLAAMAAAAGAQGVTGTPVTGAKVTLNSCSAVQKAASIMLSSAKNGFTSPSSKS